MAALLQLLVRHVAEKEKEEEDEVRGQGGHPDAAFGGVEQLVRDCFSVLERLERAPLTPELGESSPTAALFGPPAGLELVRERLEALRGAGRVGFDTCCVLQKARDLMNSMLDTRQAMQLVGSLLFRNYLTVCGRTAGVLEALQAPPMEVLQWHQQAADVAVLLADEAEQMQLYKALRLADLQRLLAGVATASTHILRIQKAFDIFME